MKKFFKVSTLLLLLPALMFMSCKKDNADASYPTPAPTNAAVQAGDGSVTLSWTAPESENLKEYSITWTPGDGQATVQAGTTLYTATGLTNGTAYTFSIAAVYNNGQKSEVVTKQGTPAASVKPEPTDLVVTPWDKEITLSWQAPENGEGLKEYAVSWTPGNGSATVAAGTTTYTATGLTNGTQYTFSVAAAYDDGKKSNPLVEQGTPFSAAPTGLVITAPDKKANLSWKAPKNVEGLKEYAVSWTPGNGSATVKADTTGYEATGLTNGTEYTFSVAAVYDNGKQSEAVTGTATPVEAWPEAGMQNATYLNNGVVQLGIDLTHGGSIFHFSEVNTKRNLLNHADEGRFVQQSYYGEADGSKWDGKDWVWNPIQGGGWRGQKPEILSQNITSSSLEIVSVPVHWASGKLLTECQMEEKITLDGDVAHIHYTFRNTGADATDHPATEQEVPAVFVDYALKNLVYYKGDSPWTNAALTTVVPGWPNEKHTRDEHWAAYVDDSQWGIGVYSPGSSLSTNYRFNGGSSGPTGGSCSYFAPLRTFAITKGLVFEYDVYLKIGTVDEIRSRFAQIRMNGEDVDDDPNFPKGYFYIKDSNNLTVEEEASSPTTGYTYKLTATGADASFTTQRVADGISDKVLTFEYKSGKAISLAIVLDDITQTVYKIKPLSAASQWTTYSFDLGQQIAEAAWGGIGSRFRLVIGDGAGTELELRNLHIRARNAEESTLAAALFLGLQTESANQLGRFEDLTDYFSYETGYSYLYEPSEPEAGKPDDPYIFTASLTRDIAADENYLSFEYKCAKSASLELFLQIAAGGSIPNLSIPASNDWKSITFDLTAGKAQVLQNFPNAGKKGDRLRFDINNINGTPLYIRAIRLHKK